MLYLADTEIEVSLATTPVFDTKLVNANALALVPNRKIALYEGGGGGVTLNVPVNVIPPVIVIDIILYPFVYLVDG